MVDGGFVIVIFKCEQQVLSYFDCENGIVKSKTFDGQSNANGMNTKHNTPDTCDHCTETALLKEGSSTNNSKTSPKVCPQNRGVQRFFKIMPAIFMACMKAFRVVCKSGVNKQCGDDLAEQSM